MGDEVIGRGAPLQRTVSMKLESSPGAARVLLERDRQIFEEGWSEHHDDEHRPGALLTAAACYAEAAQVQILGADIGVHFDWGVPEGWPWADEWWKPSEDPVRNLVKAGALIAAEIDRVLRNRERAFGLEAEYGLVVQDDSDGV